MTRRLDLKVSNWNKAIADHKHLSGRLMQNRFWMLQVLTFAFLQPAVVELKLLTYAKLFVALNSDVIKSESWNEKFLVASTKLKMLKLWTLRLMNLHVLQLIAKGVSFVQEQKQTGNEVELNRWRNVWRIFNVDWIKKVG
jgi:hypothetical protein